MIDKLTVRVGLAATLFIWIFAASTSISAQQQQRPAPSAAAQPAAARGYVGESTCVTCHDQKYTGTAHGLKSDPHTPAATLGCESCHGPGKAHVDADGDPAKIVNDFKKMNPQQASAVCATCHTSGTHAFWAGSQHDQRNVSCVTCHSVHDPKGEHQLKAASEM